jgi:hypothetical protein
VRQLTELEATRVKAFTSRLVELTLIEPTATGFRKSILDVTAPVRNYLAEKGLHDYELQAQGPGSKVLLDTKLLSAKNSTPSRASLYRPKTKTGDPRIWFRGLAAYSETNDILAIIAFDKALHVVNISRVPVEEIISEARPGPILDLVNEINRVATSVSDELLARLRQIARSRLIQSVMDTRADTAIGRTVERALGIPMNSSRKPDYKGIELKSFRVTSGSSQNRKTLFAQVPNWKLSRFKSSAEILGNFGYQRDDDFKLYCTVSTRNTNSQGLSFRFDPREDLLLECSNRAGIGDFAVWVMGDLRKRLIEKHNETFWISAESHRVDGQEHFQFQSVLHTREPIASQFDILVEQGVITMDHLIKRNAGGRVSEKGPLFKIEGSSLGLLFPPPVTYNLQEKN